MLHSLLKFFFFIVAVILTGLAVEKALHPDYPATECARALRKTIHDVLVGLFGNSTRHVFDDHLESGFWKIIDGYRDPAFDPAFKAEFIQEVPCVIINFVSKDVLQEDELNKLSRSIRLKFSHYLCGYNLNWLFFTEYHTNDTQVKVILFYSELDEDRQPLMKRYRQVIRLKSTPDNGVLRDEALDRELRHGH